MPHVGWNDLQFPADDWLFRGIRPAEANFYFVHSFQMVCHDPADRLATTDYGGVFASSVWQDNIFATQFHPEKSQAVGLRILANFAELAGETGATAAAR